MVYTYCFMKIFVTGTHRSVLMRRFKRVRPTHDLEGNKTNLLIWKPLTLCILMDFSYWFDTINFGLDSPLYISMSVRL